MCRLTVMAPWDEGRFGDKVQGVSVRLLPSNAYEVKRSSRDPRLKKSVTVRNPDNVRAVALLLQQGEPDKARHLIREKELSVRRLETARNVCMLCS